MRKENCQIDQVIKLFEKGMTKKEIDHCLSMIDLTNRLESILLLTQRLRRDANKLGVNNVSAPLEEVTYYFVKAFTGIHSLYTDPRSRGQLEKLIKENKGGN